MDVPDLEAPMMAKLFASVALALPLVLLGAPRAEASTWTGLCTLQATTECVTADGVNGDSVIGANESQGQADQNISLIAINGPCGNPQVADGSDADDGNCPPNTWWPWGTGFHFLDTQVDQSIVVDILNRNNCLVSGQAGNAQILQDSNCGAGHLWADERFSGFSLLIGVAASQNHSEQELMAANGIGDDLTTRPTDVFNCGTAGGNISTRCRWHRVS